jgi:GST-like protein
LIDYYAWGTGNGRRPLIMLEEADITYRLIPTNIREGEQKKPEYLQINPYGKIPALIDPDGPGGKPATVFESCAILLYLGEKSAKFMGTDAAARVDVLKWLMFAAASVLPIVGALRNYPDMTTDAERVLDLMELWLGSHDYLAGDYSIADMAAVTRFTNMTDSPLFTSRGNVKRWYDTVIARPAVDKALTLKIG